MDHAPAPVHTQELHRRVLEQHWELLEGLIDPGSNVSDGGGKKIAVLASRQTAVPRLDPNTRGGPDETHPHETHP